MGSRYADCDDAIEDWLAYGRYRARVMSHLRGQYGRAGLIRLREALLAMPERKLAQGVVVLNGECCAIGALAIHQHVQASGLSWDAAAIVVQAEIGTDYQDRLVSEDVGVQHGLDALAASEVAYVNDEECYYRTQEERWQDMVDWIDTLLAGGAGKLSTVGPL